MFIFLQEEINSKEKQKFMNIEIARNLEAVKLG
jgi:hypothetical protein